MGDLLLLAVRLLLGFTFLLAGSLKIVGGRYAMLGHIRDFGVPHAVALPLSIALPPLEVLMAGCLMLGIHARAAALGLAVLATAFALGMVLLLVRGKTADCGCFGSRQASLVSWTLVGRNAVLTALGLVTVGLGPGAGVLLPEAPTTALVGPFVILVVLGLRRQPTREAAGGSALGVHGR